MGQCVWFLNLLLQWVLVRSWDIQHTRCVRTYILCMFVHISCVYLCKSGTLNSCDNGKPNAEKIKCLSHFSWVLSNFKSTFGRYVFYSDRSTPHFQFYKSNWTTWSFFFPTDITPLTLSTPQYWAFFKYIFNMHTY